MKPPRPPFPALLGMGTCSEICSDKVASMAQHQRRPDCAYAAAMKHALFYNTPRAYDRRMVKNVTTRYPGFGLDLGTASADAAT
jgi:hypothetical protein